MPQGNNHHFIWVCFLLAHFCDAASCHFCELSGVMTAMWAYGPALGFGLSSYTSQLWISLGKPPTGVTADSAEWIGAWWLGLVVLCVLYIIVGLPFFFYPKTLQRKRLALTSEGTGDVELMTLQDLTKANSYVSRKDENTVKWCVTKLAGRYHSIKGALA